MNTRNGAAFLAALGLVCLAAGTAPAERTTMVRTEGLRVTGTRPDITVPYLTSGPTAFGAYSVRPRIYSSPMLDDPANPGVRPVYNLPFYGGVQAFGSKANGAVQRTTRLTPR
jgi:hypothetical protein